LFSPYVKSTTNSNQLEPNLSFIGFNNLGSLYGETEHFAIE